MRTTVELPDYLPERAKRFAIENGVTLDEVMMQGLKRVLTPVGDNIRRRMETAPIRLSANNVLRRLPVEDIKQIEAEDEPRFFNEIYRDSSDSLSR